MKKEKRNLLLTVIITYVVVIAVYILGDMIGKQTALEYRFWVEAVFRITGHLINIGRKILFGK